MGEHKPVQATEDHTWAKRFICIVYAVQFHCGPLRVTAFQMRTRCSSRSNQTGDTVSAGATLKPSPGDSTSCGLNHVAEQ